MNEKHARRQWERLRFGEPPRTTGDDAVFTLDVLLETLVHHENRSFRAALTPRPDPLVHVLLTPDFDDRKGMACARCVARATIQQSPQDRGTIEFLSKLFTLPWENVVALVRHELGHLYDDRVTEPGAEQRADDIAEKATGERISYDEHDIQTVGRGAWPRPLRLPR